MKISSSTRTALGEPTQVCLPGLEAGLTTTALAGSGGAIAAGAASSSCITHQQYANIANITPFQPVLSDQSRSARRALIRILDAHQL
jgi:hypothetical protein